MSRDVLFVGLPRSGTSWVGAVLGSSPSVEYLREPITQSWLEAGYKSPLVDPSVDLPYRDHAAGFVREGDHRRLIKEVNPLLIPYVMAESAMQVVLLHRHPCAVALSYYERGWKHLDIEDRFGVESTGDFWRDHGIYQAVLLSGAAAAIKGIGVVVSYEELTRKPQKAYADLASALDLRWESASREYLSGTLSGGDREDPYALRRDAEATRDRWRSRLSIEQQEAVIAGYLHHSSGNLPKPKRHRRGRLRP